jgi:hypothetical protein
MSTPTSTNLMQPQNRRGADRRPIDLFVNRFVNGQPYLCRATDISPSGMRILPLLEPMSSTGTRFMGLQFQLPGCHEVLTASGEVVFGAEGDGPVGVRFTRLPTAAAAVIDRFLAAR